MTANFESLSSQAQQGRRHDGQADERTTRCIKRLNAVTTNLEQLTAKLNQGQGTMGQLMNDKQLYDNMNRTVTEMQQPARRHPEGPEEVPERQDEHLLKVGASGEGVRGEG